MAAVGSSVRADDALISGAIIGQALASGIGTLRAL
jgi:hypothetical protein